MKKQEGIYMCDGCNKKKNQVTATSLGWLCNSCEEKADKERDV